MPELEEMTERLLSHTLSPLPSVADLRRRNRRRRQRRWEGASVSSAVVIALLGLLVVLPGLGVNSSTGIRHARGCLHHERHPGE